MDRIFMARADALELLVRARQAALDHDDGAATEHAHAKLDFLNRLILDVRACRVNEFQIDGGEHRHVIVSY